MRLLELELDNGSVTTDTATNTMIQPIELRRGSAARCHRLGLQHVA